MEIFFFISGFVICRGMLKEATQTKTVSLFAFYIRRMFRILPPLWLYLLALVILIATDIIPTTFPQIVKSALFLCNLDFSGGCSWFAAHTWSLAYEEQFYLVFPLLFIFIPLTKRPSLACIFVLVCMTVSVIARISNYIFVADYLSYLSFLGVGCVAALYELYFSKMAQRMSSLVWCLLIIVLCALVWEGGRVHSLFLYGTFLCPVLIALIVLGAPVNNMLVGSFFLNPFIGYLGRISYTAYLWQQLATAPWPNLSPWWNIVFVASVWVVAHISWQFLERPLLALGQRYSDAIKHRLA